MDLKEQEEQIDLKEQEDLVDLKRQEELEGMEEDLRLEDVLAQVEKCIERLEDPQISLEDSFRCYEEGIRKLKICNGKVDQIEKKMMVINERGGLEEFCM